jgi:glycosyltransferase involved in cell wall biosynthesis
MGQPQPRVVIAAPLFNKAVYLESAVASLLAQTYRDFALLLIDDRSDDATGEIARRFAAADARVEYHLNPRRLGMLGNTNRAFALARERHPGAEFWALGSDHDLWAPRWLESLVGLLDAHPEAVLAYPQSVRIDEHGMPYDRGGKPPWRSQTLGLDDARARLGEAYRGMVAGDMIYGLFRARALDELGRLYRPVLVPDRLLLSELALRGAAVQAPEVLWRRRFRGLATLERQRTAFFLDAVPPYARLPWWAQHTGALAVAYVWHGEGAPRIGRMEGARFAVTYLRLALAHRARRRLVRLRRRRSRYRLQRIARRAAQRLMARYGPDVGPAMRARLGALDRHPVAGPVTRRALSPLFERAAAAANAPAKPQRAVEPAGARGRPATDGRDASAKPSDGRAAGAAGARARAGAGR